MTFVKGQLKGVLLFFFTLSHLPTILPLLLHSRSFAQFCSSTALFICSQKAGLRMNIFFSDTVLFNLLPRVVYLPLSFLHISLLGQSPYFSTAHQSLLNPTLIINQNTKIAELLTATTLYRQPRPLNTRTKIPNKTGLITKSSCLRPVSMGVRSPTTRRTTLVSPSRPYLRAIRRF